MDLEVSQNGFSHGFQKQLLDDLGVSPFKFMGSYFQQWMIIIYGNFGKPPFITSNGFITKTSNVFIFDDLDNKQFWIISILENLHLLPAAMEQNYHEQDATAITTQFLGVFQQIVTETNPIME